ncbi:hypothetical protein L249_8325 [Ophiocordyceps polyrhachis-furcata BCC 54312]|uniref:Uncharacterized protein n=1 Tax=Ophiocordyceps polyrhachis-furcata BCC 54312 TaxID=1330021 RepID=A0A367KZD9_9HYPO|nr:hypothetical protein L249_8325 [Ophiocordyceps polyrhachis-furcata BCC 54312]
MESCWKKITPSGYLCVCGTIFLPAALSSQLSALSFQLSALSCQLSALSSQLSALPI